MKSLFSIHPWMWGVILFLLSGGNAIVLANTPVIGGKVKYVFETITLTKAEAEAIVNDPNPANRYIDLWAYAYFSKEGFSNYLSVADDGTVTATLTFQSNTHSYTLVDEMGNVADLSDIARFAVENPESCTPGRLMQPAAQPGLSAAPYRKGIQPSFIANKCPEYGYSASANPGSLQETGTCVSEGDWYKVKLYVVRFEYRKAESFHVSFYGGTSGPIDEALDVTTFTIADGAEPLVWEGHEPSDNTDWVSGAGLNTEPSLNPKPEILEIVPGGVEIVSGLEGTLALEKACPGTDISGTLGLGFPDGKTIADYTVTYALKNAAQTVALNTPADIALNTGTAPFALTLTVAGQNKLKDADSLIATI